MRGSVFCSKAQIRDSPNTAIVGFDAREYILFVILRASGPGR